MKYPRYFVPDKCTIKYWKAVSNTEIYYYHERNLGRIHESGSHDVKDLLRAHRFYGIREVSEAELALILTL